MRTKMREEKDVEEGWEKRAQAGELPENLAVSWRLF